MTINPWNPCKGCGHETTYPDYCLPCWDLRDGAPMNYDEQEEAWEARYANYLDEQMEAQYHAELEERYIEELAAGPFEVLSGSNLECEICGPAQFDFCRCPVPPTEPESLAHQLLHLPLNDPDSGAATVGEFFGLLLSTLWIEVDQFSGKRPFGNSSWQYPVYIAMSKAGMAELELDEDGYIDTFTVEAEKAADELILAAIRLAYDHGV